MSECSAESSLTRARPLARRSFTDQRGSVGLMFGFMLPVLVGFAGVSADYANLSAQRTKLQTIADSAALAAAREFRLGNANIQVLNQVATAHASGSLAGQSLTATVTPRVDLKARSITVNLSSEVRMLLLQYVSGSAARINAVATARMVGGAPICVIGLNSAANATIEMDKSAKLEAPNCSVYSNSSKPNGLVARNNATMRAAFICSAGGRSSPGPGSFAPTPQTDCPIIPDPLLSRALPGSGGCLQTGAAYKGGSVNLVPGTYCGGASFTAGAKVTLQPGIYVFKDGPLVVADGSSFSGANVALHFVGTNAELRFEAASSISLTAPRSGSMAGILISEDRANSGGLVHSILSDDARTLLGTIYLPRGRLHVGANKPVADRSAYTIVVASRFTLSEGPTMVLNTNYFGTDIPVPEGVGPLSSQVVLAQ